MAYIEPAKPRFVVSKIPEGVRLAIPARRNWFVVLFLLVWLGGWTFGETSAVRGLMSGKVGGSYFMIFWLCGWTIGGVYCAYMILWMLSGQEIILAKRYPPGLSVRRSLFGVLLKSEDFDVSQVRRLRVSLEIRTASGFYSRPSLWGARNIAFDYGARTHYLGAGLDDAEAQMVVAVIQESLPSLTV